MNSVFAVAAIFFPKNKIIPVILMRKRNSTTKSNTTKNNKTNKTKKYNGDVGTQEGGEAKETAMKSKKESLLISLQ